LQFLWIFEESAKTASKTLGVARVEEVDCQVFSFCHLLKILEVGAYDGHTIGARQMSDSAAAGR
jgi:hypothetical protein